MKTTIPALAVTLALLSTAAATAHDFKIGDLEVAHPMAFETPPTAQSAAGYMNITNSGDTADRLMEIRGAFPRLEVHTTEMTDGVARMMHVESIEIPPGETVTLEPGGLHVMFMGLGGDPFEPEEKIPATLVFENAGTLDVVFNVEARPEAGAATDHSGHATN